MRKIRLSALAETDLVDLWLYIARENPRAADRLIELLYAKCRILASSPMIGVERRELALALRSFPVGSYVIFYRITKKGIEIARVLSGKRDLAQLFRKS